MTTSYAFSRRGPDRIAEEVVAVLSGGASFEFKSLFSVVYANLKARQAAGGGEEMLRLRTYEKLQNLVQAGIVKKTLKEYKGVPKAVAAFLETAAAMSAGSPAPAQSEQRVISAKATSLRKGRRSPAAAAAA